MANLLTWDQVGEKFYETGLDRGVLYLMSAGVFDNGEAWNGLTAISESPSGGEPSALWANNRKYLEMMSVEDLALSLDAYTYPDSFALCDGSVEPVAGVAFRAQERHVFGLSYRTRIGNDEDGDLHGYKLHLVYGCRAAPSDMAHDTVSDDPEAVTMSWDITTTPVDATGYQPVAKIEIDSRTADAAKLAALEVILYGVADPEEAVRMPLPDEVITLMTPA